MEHYVSYLNRVEMYIVRVKQPHDTLLSKRKEGTRKDILYATIVEMGKII